jgi:gas vesicle protein
MANNRLYYSREAEEIANRQRTTLALAVLAIGAGLGAVLALLFAPRTGEDTRDILEKRANEALEQGRENGTKAVESMRKEMEHLRKDVEKRLETVNGK